MNEGQDRNFTIMFNGVGEIISEGALFISMHCIFTRNSKIALPKIIQAILL